MTKQELTYWVTLALMPKIWTKRKNEIYVSCFNHNPKISIVDLFEETSYWDELGLDNEEVELFMKAHDQLANNSFLVEDLLSQGYDILPIHSDEYPKILKTNLGTNSPTVIFTKGNKKLLQEPSLAIVGSRKADNTSLTFTENIARAASSANKVVVSGFAKGVDKQALDSTLEAGGKSIIILPQGIMTFASGFKQYFRDIADGRVLVMSTFAPNAPWCVELAMARNHIIYGMASEIYVAQSDEKGGTWSGAIEGLRKRRPIFVRWPEKGEQNANVQLVQKGASAVDIWGHKLDIPEEELKTDEQKEHENLSSKIISILLTVESSSSQEITSKLNINWSDARMKKFLDSIPQITKNKIKNRIRYSLRNRQPNSLFSNQE